MANISKTNSMMEFPLQIKRQYAAPIDTTSVFYDLESAQTYAQSGATAYVGQQLVVVDETEGTAKAYVISNTSGDLTEVGSATLGDDKSISLVDGTLSLKNFGVQYYKFIPDTESTESTYELTTGFKAGLEPKVRLLESGGYEIAWYEPNPTTVEGLQSAITALQGSVSTLENNVYTKTEIDDKLSKIPEWGEI